MTVPKLLNGSGQGSINDAVLVKLICQTSYTVTGVVDKFAKYWPNCLNNGSDCIFANESKGQMCGYIYAKL